MFLELPEVGKTEWWRYVIGFLLVLFFWFVLGSVGPVLLAIFSMIDGNPDTFLLSTGFVSGIDPMINFVVVNVSFITLMAGLVITVVIVHGRPFRTLITPFKQINWRRIAQGFTVYLLLVTLTSGVEFVMNPEIYMFTLNWQRFVPFALLILIFTPIQTSAEELFFRGYLLQACGHILKNPVGLIVINGILFMLPHLANPEVASGPVLLALYYFGIGAFFAFVTLRDNGLELAIGAHAANNMYAAVFANYTDSVLPTDSIFTVTELDPVFGLVSFVVIAILFYVTLLRDSRDAVSQIEFQEKAAND
ncbi:MAG: CPBP family intramembrane metalloprotease [Chloroflexi bacterium]|nr:MAG: CPBP family intramembrane metalloprotease [Chloroflexota bacterium]